MGMEYLSVVANLALVIVLVLVSFFLFKKFALARTSATQGNLAILNALAISHKEKILLLRVENRRILIGVTAHNISTLLVLDSTIDNSASSS